MSRNSAKGIWRRPVSRRELAALTAGGGAALLLVGCGSSNNNGGNAAAKPATTAPTRAAVASGTVAPGGASGTAAPAAAAAAPRKKPTSTADVPWTTDLANTGQLKNGGTVTTTQSLTWPSIDPLKNAAADPGFYHGMHSSTLVAADASPGITLFQDPIVPDIAEKWEQPDASTYVFHINPKAKWNDKPPANGRVVTADDVKFSLQRWASGGTTAPRFIQMDQVTSVDPATVKITTKGPTGEFLLTLGFEYHPILNPEYVQKIGNDLGEGGPEYVGSGPFMLSDLTPRQKATWVRNPTYFGVDKFGQQLPYLDKVVWNWIIDRAAQLAAFDANQIDSTAISTNLFGKYNSSNDYYIGKSGSSAGMNIVGFNLRKAPGNDPRIRKAVSLAMDRRVIADQVYGGLAAPPAPLPPKATGQSTLATWDQVPPNYKRDVQQAKQLLSAAGSANLNLGTLWYYDVGSPEWVNAVLLIQQQLKEAGITVTPQVIDRSKQLDDYFGGKWDGLQMEYATNPGVSNQAWADWMHSKAQNNYWGINDPQVDSLVEQLRSTIDEQQRQKMFTFEYDNVYRPWGFVPTSMTVFRGSMINPGGNSFLAYKYYGWKYTARA